MQRHAFTLVELLVTVAVVALVIVVVVAMLPAPTRRTVCNSSQLRGIHTGLVLYAQGNSGHYPGLDATGTAVDPTVEGRFRTLLEERWFTSDYAIRPSELAVKQFWISGPVDSGHYSFSMPSLADRGARRGEWRQTENAEAVALSDRLVFTASGHISSVHAKPRSRDDWRGEVAWNDGHVTFVRSHILSTRHGKVVTEHDHLFEAAGADDAYMIHSGQ